MSQYKATGQWAISSTKLLCSAVCASLLSLFALSSESYAAEEALHVTGFDYTYVHSYDFDLCGDNEAGRWDREAIAALAETCQLPVEEKERFYKYAAFSSEPVLSVIVKAATTKSFPVAHPLSNDSLSCKDHLAETDTKELRARLLQYHLGKAELTNVFINLFANKPFENMSLLCKEFSKEPFKGLKAPEKAN